jgi:hypothetical protein
LRSISSFLLFQADYGGPGGDEDLVELGESVAHLLDGFLEHHLGVLAEGDEETEPRFEHPAEPAEHGGVSLVALV